MPKANDIKELSPARQRAYRAIWALYQKTGSSPSMPEIAAEGNLQLGNLFVIALWLEKNGWIRKNPKQHRSIVPLVKLTKRSA